MNQKTLTLLLTSYICLALCSSLITFSPAHAATEQIVNGGFETGDSSGWTLVDGTVQSSEKHTGSYAAQIYPSGSRSLNQTLDPYIPVNDVDTFTMWYKQASSGSFITITYTDDTTDISYISTTGAWTQKDVKAFLTADKTIKDFMVTGGSSDFTYVDDVSLMYEPAEYLVNTYCSPDSFSIGFTIDGNPFMTPNSQNLTSGSHTFVRTFATKVINSSCIYGFEYWSLTNGTGTFNTTGSTLTIDLQTQTNITLVYSAININITSSPEINANFTAGGYAFSTPKLIQRNKGSHTFVCTTYQYYPNESFVYTFDHWLVNGTSSYGSLTLIQNCQDDTNLTIVYTGTPIAPPYPYVYARGALNATWYMRSDTHTIHAQLGYKLLTVNTNTPTFDERLSATTQNVSYGVRVWIFDLLGHTYELTSGTPMAIALKEDTGGEMLTAYWTCPAYSGMIDSIMIKVYQRFDEESWSLRKIFVTSSDLLIRLPAATWTLHYYVTRTEGSTNSTFGFGSYTTYNSRVDLQYYKASPWDVALARLWQRNFVGFIFTPWTYWFGNLFWAILLFGCIVMAWLRTGSFKLVLALLWIFGGSGSILWALIPATALHIAALMLALAMAITLFRLIYK